MDHIQFHLLWAQRDILSCNYRMACEELKAALSEANRLHNKQLRGLIFRALNSIRPLI
jgi:hypothetical protein